MNKCQGCQERYPACQDHCEIHQARVDKIHQAAERRRELNSSIGWDGYIKHNKTCRAI
jgi:hypothetical protein